MHTKLSKVSIKIGLVLLGSILAIIFFEMGIRSWPKYSEPDFKRQDPDIGRVYKKNLEIDMRREGGGGTIRFVTNSIGFIGEDWSQKQSGIRIANQCDTYTSARDSVFYKDNSSTLTGEILSERLGGVPVESLNFSIEGQGTLDEFNTYLKFGQKVNPQIVILWMFLGNDFYDNVLDIYEDGGSGVPRAQRDQVASVTENTRTQQREEPGLITNMIRHSEVARLAREKISEAGLGPYFYSFFEKIGIAKFVFHVTIASRPLPPQLTIFTTGVDDEKNSISVERTKEYLKEFSKKVTDDGKKFFVVMIPAHFQVDDDSRERFLLSLLHANTLSAKAKDSFDPLQPNRLLKEVLNDLSIPFLDLADPFTKVCSGGDCPIYICNLCHLSSKGHRLAAELVADELYKRYFSKN